MAEQEQRLVTLEEYRKATPWSQGYLVYMQAAWPGSELKDEKNPYPEGTAAHSEWEIGQQVAYEHVLDAEG